MTNLYIEAIMLDEATRTFLVKGDDPRFGQDEILAQFPSYEEAQNWIEVHDPETRSIMEMVEDQAASRIGKIQFGNSLFRRIQIVNGRVYGTSHSYGRMDITDHFDGAVVTGRNKGTTSHGMSSWAKNTTIRFGSECTW